MKKRILSLILASTMVLSMGMVASATDATSEANAATNNQSTSKVVIALTPKASDVLSVTVPMYCPLAITYDANRKNGETADPGYVVTAPNANSYKIVNNSASGVKADNSPNSATRPTIAVDDITIKQTDATAASNFELKNTLTTTEGKEMKFGIGTTTNNAQYFKDLGKASADVNSLFNGAEDPLKKSLNAIAEEQPLVIDAKVGKMKDEEIAKTNTFTISYTFKFTPAN